MVCAETQKKALITQCIYREAKGRLKTADNLLHIHYLMNAFVQRILLYNKIVMSSTGNKTEENSLCHFSLLTSRGDLDRPVFVFNKRDDTSIFNSYSGFIEEGWNSMSNRVWPEKSMVRTERTLFGKKKNDKE